MSPNRFIDKSDKNLTEDCCSFLYIEVYEKLQQFLLCEMRFARKEGIYAFTELTPDLSHQPPQSAQPPSRHLVRDLRRRLTLYLSPI